MERRDHGDLRPAFGDRGFHTALMCDVSPAPQNSATQARLGSIPRGSAKIPGVGFCAAIPDEPQARRLDIRREIVRAHHVDPRPEGRELAGQTQRRQEIAQRAEGDHDIVGEGQQASATDRGRDEGSGCTLIIERAAMPRAAAPVGQGSACPPRRTAATGRLWFLGRRRLAAPPSSRLKRSRFHLVSASGATSPYRPDTLSHPDVSCRLRLGQSESAWTRGPSLARPP